MSNYSKRLPEDYIEVPRDIYRPGITAIRINSVGSHMHGQIVFYKKILLIIIYKIDYVLLEKMMILLKNLVLIQKVIGLVFLKLREENNFN